MKAFKIKTYQVDGYDDSGSVIVFAKHAVTARRKGANELGIDFKSVDSCHRRPGWDKYAEQGWVPAEDLVNGGWWLECHGCYARCNADEFDCIGVDIHPVFDGGEVYCSLKCQRAAHRRRKLEKRAEAAIPRYVQKRWPGAEVIRSNALIWHRTGERSAYATIRFPGGQYGVDIRFREGEANRRSCGTGHIKKYPAVFVTQADLPAWHEFVGLPTPSNLEGRAVA